MGALQHADILLHEVQGGQKIFASLCLEVLGEEAQSSRLLLCEATRKAESSGDASHAQVLLKSFDLLGFTPLDKI